MKQQRKKEKKDSGRHRKAVTEGKSQVVDLASNNCPTISLWLFPLSAIAWL
jgi:hypothetical protein